MANLASFSLLRERVLKFQSDYTLDDAGIAFDHLILEAILGLNEDEIEDAITDGPMDGGIDAIQIVGRDVHLFNNKYATDFEHTRRQFPENETTKILATVDGIFAKHIHNSDVNEALWEKITQIWDAFDQGPLRFKIHLCSNKQKLDIAAQKRFERALAKHRVIDVYYYDQEDVVNNILERKYKKVDGQVTFIEKQYFDRSDGPLKGIVATISALDLIELIKNPEDETISLDDAFNENVRVYQQNNKINKRIRATALSDTNYEFWYLNNGITIVCEKCDFMPTRSPRATLTNFQIVNGGQTTHALFDVFRENKEKLENVLLLVRICETRDTKISEKISETTNSQTPVNTRDLHANDEIQKKLEEEFLSLGYFYERKKNQHQTTPKNLRLDSELLGQIYLAFYLDKPSEAKNTKSLVHGDDYEKIFDETITTARRMLLPYRIYLPVNQMKVEIQRKKRRKEKINETSAFVSRATFHILNAVRYIGEHFSLDYEKNENIEKATKLAIKLIREVTVKEKRRRKDLYTHDKFFKEIQTNALVRDHILEKLKAMGKKLN